jgi:hypothetical protein
MPPDEKARLEAFAAKVGRPMGWIIRDALAVYIEAAEADASAMARLLKAPKVKGLALGKTPQTPTGPKPKAPASYVQ